MLKAIAILLLLASTGLGQGSAKHELQVWQLEKAYWDTFLSNPGMGSDSIIGTL
jgi:hypothetical protein